MKVSMCVLEGKWGGRGREGGGLVARERVLDQQQEVWVIW